MKDYLINSAVEINEMTHDVAFAVLNYPICDIEDIYKSRDSYEAVSIIYEHFNNWYHKIAKPDEKSLVNIYGAYHLKNTIISISESISFDLTSFYFKSKNIRVFCDNSFDMSITNSFFNNKSKFTQERKKLLRINSENEIYERTNLMNVLSGNRLKTTTRMISDLLCRYNEDNNKDSYLTIKEEYLRKQKAFIEMLDNYRDNNIIESEDYLVKNLKISHKNKYKNVKKIIKRSIKAFSSIFGEDKIKLFISGEGFIFEGNKFNYKISKSNYKIEEHTSYPITCHIPYSLKILSKENEYLCKACVLFEETPIIDQITSLCLHISSGNEDLFLNIANFFDRSDDFYKHFNEKKYEIKNISKVPVDINTDDFNYVNKEYYENLKQTAKNYVLNELINLYKPKDNYDLLSMDKSVDEHFSK